MTNARIHNGENGILTGGADAASTHGMYVAIFNSEINNNGAPASRLRYGCESVPYPEWPGLLRNQREVPDQGMRGDRLVAEIDA
ncbi:MAG: hypothetical protein P4L71_17580 [Acetobacteraceae bacterium]|nr:hypothetical protein [Acetobacteraceae bacterium]